MAVSYPQLRLLAVKALPAFDCLRFVGEVKFNVMGALGAFDNVLCGHTHKRRRLARSTRAKGEDEGSYDRRYTPR
jgi:hypothetical protein